MTLKACLGGVLLAAALAGCTTKTPGPPFLAATPCATPPVVDGMLDDECWRDAAVAADFSLLREDGPAGNGTTVRVTYDDTCVYFGFTCPDHRAGELVTRETEHDAAVCRDDCIDLFLDLSRDYKNYFHFIVSPRGVTSDSSVELVDDFVDIYYDWEPAYRVRTSVTADAWFAEFAVPFSSLMTGVARPSVFADRKENERSAFSLLAPPASDPGTVWNVNFCRRKRTDPDALSSWSPCCDSFYSPYQFGHLLFAGSLSRSGISNARERAEEARAGAVAEKNRVERARLAPILAEIGGEWRDVHRRGLFQGSVSTNGKLRIPNYARLTGQGRVVLDEVIPPLSGEAVEKILARRTPRLAFDEESLEELRRRIESDAPVREQWKRLEEEADGLLAGPLRDFTPNEMQQDRNCVPREQAKSAAAGYGRLSSVRTKCALAHAISGRREYAEKAWEAQSRLIEHFERYQVFRSADNWYSIWDPSYEVVSSTLAYDLLAGSGVLSREEKVRLVEFIRRLGYRVDYCVRHSEMVGNHQYMWTANLGRMALYFPEFPERERWLADVERRMPMLYADILQDGGQVERSPGHHTFGLSFLVGYAITRKRLLGEDVFSREIDGKSLGMAVSWMAKIATPLGEQPAVNDSKRPRLGKYFFLLDVIDAFGRGDLLRAGKIDTSGLPLLHLVSETIRPADPAFTSVLLPDTGFAVMRDGWDADSKYLLFDYGPHGAWHGHYDKMSFVLYADGVGWVLDAGSSPHYCVYTEEHNRWHKQTVAHNTVLVDGKSQEAVTGTLRRWETGEDFDLVSASHDGYPGIIHTRTIFHPRGEYFLVHDHLRARDGEPHRYRWLLHVNGRLGAHDRESIAFTRNGRGLLVLPADPESIDSLTVEQGLCIDTTGKRTTPARSDGRWTPGDPGWAYIPYIGLSKTTGAAETDYLVVLFPHRDGAKPPAVEVAKLLGGVGTGVRIRHGGLEDVYGERRPGADRTAELPLGGFRTDGDFFFARIERGNVTRAVVVGGTRLIRDGKPVKARTYE